MSAETPDKPFDKDSILDRMWQVHNKSKPVLKSFQRNIDRAEDDLKVPGLQVEPLTSFRSSMARGKC